MDAQALGRYLRQSREAKELTLDDAEQALKIRKRILEMFELGDFGIAELSSIQIRGFIRNYARYLGLDEERVVQHYDAALSGGGERRGSLIGGARLGRNKPAKPKAKKKSRREREAPPPSNGGIPNGPRSITDTHPKLPAVQVTERSRDGVNSTTLLTALFRLLIAGAALAVIVFVIVQLVQPRGGGVDPIAEDIIGQLPPTLTYTVQPSFTPAATIITVQQDQAPTFSGSGVAVLIEMQGRSWMRIQVDGVEQFTGIAREGERFEYQGAETIIVNAASAEAIQVTYNGQRQQSLGIRGQRVDLTFTTQGIEISSGPGYDPTAIASNTPMPTPTDPAGALIAQLTPTDTPGPSPTPSETFTPSPTYTDTLTPSQTYTPSETFTPSATFTATLTPSQTLPPSNTPTETLTPSVTPIPSNTLTPSPTAIVPVRQVAPDATPTKSP